ncbi:helix-turn-helix transcriptional regulator [Paenibacillus glacialis]|uniref:Transcriptional regulator n=1 Tax=Paenibacillus glacialis TaxID=494026 RepID=A0A168K737_9BACL|nr:YafY family protein [Paenibacillus glacialis]OAB41639.1 transcriptional regulator [Paenibacillus glacialis]
MRLHRLIGILLLIESRGKIKAKELADALETSTRSIYRDIDALAEAGIPIATTSGSNGGVYLMEGYAVNPKQLHIDDVINLYLTGIGIYSDGKTESGLKLKNTLLKLEQTLPQSYQTDIQKVKARFYFDDTPWWTEREIIPSLEILRVAVLRSQKIRIVYSKVNGDSSSRTLHSYGLVVKKTEWYLVAFCEEAKEIRTFKCQRIIKAELQEEIFESPQYFSIEDHWKKQETNFKQSRKNIEHYLVKLKVTKTNKNFLHKLEILHTQQYSDHRLITAEMYSYEAACQIVLEIIDHVEILEPEQLRQYIKVRLLKLLDIYA